MARPRHVLETYIKATPEQIWQALTDPDLTRRYYYGLAFESTWQPDDAYVAMTADRTPAIEGTIVEAVPHHRLVMTFHMLFDAELVAEPPSLVTFEITPVGAACRLSCIHGELFAAPKTWAMTATGWNVVLAGIKTLIETGTEIGDLPDDGASPLQPSDAADVVWHRAMGIEANNSTYDLLAKTDRTSDDDDLLVHRAHAAAWHWGIAGTLVHRARAEYLVARVYAFLGRPEAALHHARRCQELVAQAELSDFDLAFAHEALARALACAGDLDGARRERALAVAVPIADPQDRAIVDGDLADGPWYGAV